LYFEKKFFSKTNKFHQKSGEVRILKTSNQQENCRSSTSSLVLAVGWRSKSLSCSKLAVVHVTEANFQGLFVQFSHTKGTEAKWANENYSDNSDHKQMKRCAVLLHLHILFRAKQLFLPHFGKLGPNWSNISL